MEPIEHVVVRVGFAVFSEPCAEKISMGEGLRHSVISALAEVLPERPLRAHRDTETGVRWMPTPVAHGPITRPWWRDFPQSFPQVVLAVRKSLESKKKMVEAGGTILSR